METFHAQLFGDFVIVYHLKDVAVEFTKNKKSNLQIEELY